MGHRTTIGLNSSPIIGFGLVFFLAVWALVHAPVATHGAEAPRAATVDSNIVHTITASVEYSTERVTGKQAV